MKVVILCGGLGTRLGEETNLRPKPMVTIGNQPILQHIMQIYSCFQQTEFMLTLGYKGEVIKDYFMNYRAIASDIRVDLKTGVCEYLSNAPLDWKVDLIETGLNTMTGGRLRRLESRLRNQGTFMLTYGDGLANVDIDKLLKFHKAHGKIATVTAVRPSARFGAMEFSENNFVTSFREKHQTDEGWINGGFFVFEPEIFDYLDSDATVLEGSPLERLAQEKQLLGFRHDGFWQCMDTPRDRQYLEDLWQKQEAPWRILDAR